MNSIYPQIQIIRGHLDILERLLESNGIKKMELGNEYQAPKTGIQEMQKESMSERDLVVKCLDCARAKGWDIEFLESLKRHVYSGKRLSTKQSDALLKIQNTLGI